MRGLRGLLFLLGGGAVVFATIGAVRYLRRLAIERAADDWEPEGEGAWSGAPMASAGLTGAAGRGRSGAGPEPPVAESVVARTREPEEVVDSLVPPELARDSNIGRDLILAAIVLLAAIVVVALVASQAVA